MHLQAKEKTREHAKTHTDNSILFLLQYISEKLIYKFPRAVLSSASKKCKKKQFYTLRVAIKNKISRSQREVSQILMHKCNFNGKN